MSAAAISARLTPDTAAPVTGPRITPRGSDSSISTCFEHESDDALKCISNTPSTGAKPDLTNATTSTTACSLSCYFWLAELEANRSAALPEECCSLSQSETRGGGASRSFQSLGKVVLNGNGKAKLRFSSRPVMRYLHTHLHFCSYLWCLKSVMLVI